MRLREIKKECPEIFKYKGKTFYMTYYSMNATHRGERSDYITWETEDHKYFIGYDKGYVWVENEKGEIINEI